MRCGLVLYGALETLSGGYVYDRRLVEHLRAQGDEAVIISLPPRRYGRSLADNWNGWERAVAWESFDLVLQDELNHPSLVFLNRRLRQRLRGPLVAVVHHLRCSEPHPRPARHVYRWLERRYLRSVDGWLCNSHTTRQVVTQVAGVNRPAAVAYPAGDRFLQPLTPDAIHQRAQEKPLRLLFVGNLQARKGLHHLLEAITDLPPGLVQLTVVGDTTMDQRYTQHIQAYLQRHPLPVIMRGRLETAELAAVYRQSHLLALPSAYEGFGIVLLEAKGFGLPALATTAGAPAEIVRHDEDGLLSPPGDVASLRRYLLELAQDRDRLLRLSWQARASFDAFPGWEASMAQARAFLHTLAGRAP